MDRTPPRLPPRHRLRASAIVTAILLTVAVVSSGVYQLLSTQPGLALALVAAMAVAATALLRSTSPMLIGLAAVVGVVTSAAIVGLTSVALANAVAGGLTIALALVVPLGIVRMGRQRRAFVEQGWALAASEARARDVSVERTLQRERTSIAAEMHDGLGHRLTLIAVRLARLSLDDALPAAARAEIQEIRAGAATATEELGRTVQLLRDPDLDTAHDVPTVEAAIARARAAGIEVRATVPQNWHGEVGASAAAAATRMVEEGLANAARHAPGEPVELTLALAADRLHLTMRNARSESPGEPQRGGGFGLLGLRHRAELLGGEVVTERTDRVFGIDMTIPAHPEPHAHPNAGAAAAVAEQRSQASARRAGASKRAVVLPLAIVAVFVIVAGWYFVLTTTMSVLAPEVFASIEAGDRQSEVDAVLPPMEMLDAPRAVFDEPSGSDCRYYEALVSFAERTDVYVVCFDDGVVTSTGTVPAP